MILVVGDAMLDIYQHVTSTRMAPECASAPVVKAGTETRLPGGCLNTANCIRALGAEVSVLCTIGWDMNGRYLEDLVPRDYELLPCPGVTTTKTRVMLGNRMLMRIDEDRVEESPIFLSVLMEKACQMIDEGIECLVLSDYGKGVLAKPQVLIGHARAKGVPVIVDPKAKDWIKYRGCTAIKPNENECISIGEMTQTADYVVQTRGRYGMLVTGQNGQAVISPTQRNQVDCTGAGDQVIAALAVFHRMGWVTAAKIANILAGKSVEYPGVRPIKLDEARDECRRFGIEI